MPVKFNQYWTVNQDTMGAYEQFLINKYIPGINKLGIHTVAGWSVLIGGYSEIIFEGVTNDLEILEFALRDSKYKALNDQIQNYVKNYKTKVLISNLQRDVYSKAKHELKRFVEHYESRILTFHIHKVKGYKSSSYDIISV